MCFSSPKPPPVPPEDPALAEQRQAQLDAANAQKTEDKQRRLQEQITRTGGMAGFRSLISGSKGGGGFGRGLLS
jgi:hypothetical protein